MIFNVTFIVYHFQICMVCFWVYFTPLLCFVYSCILNTFITIDFFCLANWQSKTSILFSLFTSIFSLGPLLINTSLETSCPVAPIIFWEFLLVSIYNNLERFNIFTLLMLPIKRVYQCIWSSFNIFLLTFIRFFRDHTWETCHFLMLLYTQFFKLHFLCCCLQLTFGYLVYFQHL